MQLRTPAILGLAICLIVPFAAAAQKLESEQPQTQRGAELVGGPVTPYVFEGDLRDLPTSVSWRPGEPIKEIPRRNNNGPAGRLVPYERGFGLDPLLEQQEDADNLGGNPDFLTPILSFNGQGFTGVNPPDTVGDVGANHYIQMINGGGGALFTIHDKTSGAVISGPTNLDSLGSGSCSNGFGDPVVLYDRDADRWMLSEFSSSGNRLCVYVSLTSDPIGGGWCNYDFTATNFPDYPKYAAWPDAYYVGSNENSPAAYAFDRANMLTCTTARPIQRFTAPQLGGFGFQALTPSDLDGADLPPAGSPAYFLRHNDDEAHGGSTPGQDFLQIFEFDVDFVTPGNSSFTGPFNVGMSEIDSSLCGLFSFSCFDQPGGGSDLDPLREVVMWRSQYRNFGSHETLVGNLVTDVNGNDHGGIRWYELRKSGGGAWTLFQEGTYAPDSADRWMGSAAMDAAGNIAVAYNVVDDTDNVFPGLRYVGREAGDPAGTLPVGEVSLVEGSARNNSNRYGDYSSLNVDPEDDCTFWFTGEHNPGGSWSTRIGKFRFDSCGGGGGDEIPCADVDRFQARCRPGGTLQARVIFTDTSHDGDTATITIDSTDNVLPIINDRAQISMPGAAPGSHTISLTDPAGCVADVVVNCT